MDLPKLRKQDFRVQRTLERALGLVFGLFLFSSGCASLPKVEHSWHQFPKNASTGVPTRPFETLGYVRSRVNFPTLDPDHFNAEAKLCQNYFNKAVKRLVEHAKKAGGDAVVDVKSVVFLLDGRRETYPTAECVDEGGEGQVLTQGVAIRWIPPEKEPKKQSLKQSSSTPR